MEALQWILGIVAIIIISWAVWEKDELLNKEPIWRHNKNRQCKQEN